MIQLRPYQDKAVTEVATKLFEGKRKVVFQLATGGGKCLGKDTPVLMYNGEIKKVQNIKIGELLMGPDSKPRKVLTTCTGQEMLYKIIPVKGDPYIVNESHILSLKRTNIKNGHRAPSQIGGVIKNISVKDYLQKSKTFKHIYKGWRTGVDFNNKYLLPIPPYLLGVWLGDGNSRSSGFATIDNEIVKAITNYANKNNCRVRNEIIKGKCPMYYIVGKENRGRAGGGNSFKNGLISLGLLKNKHIPLMYKTASREDRMQLLAGLVDTDGCSSRCGFGFVFKNETLASDVAFVARSLGLSAYIKKCKKTCTNNGKVGDYFRISVSGDGIEIPVRIERKKPHVRTQKKSHLVTGIKVEPIGVGSYYGFEIDGDRLFMLGDFTVTHNTVVFSAISQRYTDRNPKSVLILVHRKELLQQTRRTLYNAFGISAQIIVAGMRTVPPAKVYVGMVESVVRRLNRIRNIGLVIIDEAHIASFNKMHNHFPQNAATGEPFIIGFTATPLSSNKKMPMKDFYEDIVCGVDIPELIAAGNLCQNITFAPRDTVERASLTIKGGEFEEGFMAEQFSKPQYVQNTIKAYEQWGNGSKTIIFNVNVEHSKKVDVAFRLAGYPSRHLDGSMLATERTNILNWFKHTPNAILNNVAVLTAGFDEPSIETVIINKSTKAMPWWLQTTGRGSRPTETKSAFRIIDMGGNALTHGDWCDARDWKDIFHNPPKPRKTEQVAPCKSCPQCDAILSASARTCKVCGYEFPTKEQGLEEELSDFVIVTKGIDVRGIMEANKEKKEYYPFFKIGKELAIEARRSAGPMTDEKAAFILSKYEELAKQWCHATGKHWNQWRKDRAKEHLYTELAARFKKWQSPVGLPDLTTEPPAPVVGWRPKPKPAPAPSFGFGNLTKLQALQMIG